jgi:Spy/CpxP family protein refolding chaperone
MRRLTTILFAGALIAPATLLAQGPPAGMGAGRGAGMGMGMGMGHRMAAQDRGPHGGMYAPQMLLSRRQRLELTEEQSRQLEALASEIRQAQDKAAAAAKPHEEKLHELWQADQPDVQAIQSEMQALMAARHTAGLATAAALAKSKGLLTAEQRGRVEGWMEGRAMGGRRFDRGGDGPRRGAGVRMRPQMRRF